MANVPQIGGGTGTTINASGRMINFVPLLRRQSLPNSIYGMSRETPVVTKTDRGNLRINTVPREIFVDISDKFSGGYIQVNLEWLAALSSDGVRGNTTLRGDATAEESLTFKFLRCFANLVRKGVPIFGDGPSAHELKAYIDKKGINDQLAQWVSDDLEFNIRHAILENIAPQLESAPASQSTKVHPNIWVAGDKALIPDATQPINNYSNTAATYADTVGQLADSIPNGTQGGISYKNLANLEEQLAENRIRRLSLSRGPGYIMSISNRGYNQMVNDPDIKELLQQGDVRGPQNQLLAGVMGPIFGFYFYKDDRLPRLTVTGTETKTIAFSYYGFGATDNRTGAYDCNIIHGSGAVVRGNAIAPHFVDDDDDYDLIQGLAVSRTDSIQRIQYDAETPTDTSNEVEGSFVFLTKRAA